MTKFRNIIVLVFILSIGLSYLLFSKLPSGIKGIMWHSNAPISEFVSTYPSVCKVKILSKYCKIDLTKATISFGLYDPGKKFGESSSVKIEHIFIDWNYIEDLSPQLDEIYSKNRWPLITIEPWPLNRSDGKEVLNQIVSGQYDTTIDDLCLELRSIGKPMFLRWGHEMDNVTERYPWSTNDYNLYIKAYKHFKDQCRLTYNEEVYYVWSPVGEDKAKIYWPGRDYADYVGLSIYNFDDFEKINYGKIRSFTEMFTKKYNLVEEFDRPIMIAEMGVNGNSDRQIPWLKSAFDSFGEFKLLKSVVYFNSKDLPEAWGKEYSIPDWSINSNMFNY